MPSLQVSTSCSGRRARLTEPKGRLRLRCMVVRDGVPVTILERDPIVEALRPLRQTLYLVRISALVLAVAL